MSRATHNIGYQLDVLRNSRDLTLLSLLSRSDQNLLRTDRTIRYFDSPDDLPGNQKGYSEYVAIDCEMVGVGYRGATSALGRVSIVNKWGYPLLDIYVRPEERITNYRTRWSGLSRGVFRWAEREGILYDLEDAQEKVDDIIDDRIVIGHSLGNDFDALQFEDWPPFTVDTQQFPDYSFFGLNDQPGLRSAMDVLFDISIQDGDNGHDSVEDAQAAMLLYRTFRRGFQNQKLPW